MARPPRDASLTIAKLESILNSRKSELSDLNKERAKAAKQLAAIDEKIARLSGGKVRNGGAGAAFTAGGRARNDKSLVAYMEDALASGKPVSVGDIAAAVQSAGYKSSSPNFRSIVNQQLIKEKQFTAASRGFYQLKK